MTLKWKGKEGVMKMAYWEVISFKGDPESSSQMGPNLSVDKRITKVRASMCYLGT